MLQRFFPLLGAALLLCVACAPDQDSRQGAQGELCFSDEDCRLPLVCEQNFCVASADTNNGSNNGSNNGDTNNGDTNNGVNNGDTNNGVNNGEVPSLEELCDDICETLSSCGLQDPSENRQCSLGCRQEVEDFDALYCLSLLNCRELESDPEACFEGDPPPMRVNLCEEMAWGLVANCSMDANPTAFFEECQKLALEWPAAEFYAAQDCLSFSSCQAATSCLSEWSGIDL